MSKTSAIVTLIMGLVITLLCLWVKGLKIDIVKKDAAISNQVKMIIARDRDNKTLSDSNYFLTTQIQTERKATTEMTTKVVELEAKLKNNEGKYAKATKDDKCASTIAPADVISVLQ